MKSILKKLEDREPILLMYLFEELSVPDRAEVQRMLETDAAMRAQLESLRMSQQSLMHAMQRLDEGDAVPGAPAAAARHFGRAVRQWHARRMAKPSQNQIRSRHFQWWAYPLATAAAVTLAVIIWWQTLGRVQPQQADQLATPAPMDLSSSPDDGEEPPRFALLESFEDSSSLADVERELQALQLLRESAQ